MLSQIQTLPMFTGSLGFCVQATFEHYATREGLQDGDVIVVNDPYLTGTHQWDVAVIVPGFLDGELVAYAAIKAHQLDVGALAPFVSNSTDLFQEGPIYPGSSCSRRAGAMMICTARSCPTPACPNPRPEISAHRRAPVAQGYGHCSS